MQEGVDAWKNPRYQTVGILLGKQYQLDSPPFGVGICPVYGSSYRRLSSLNLLLVMTQSTVYMIFV